MDRDPRANALDPVERETPPSGENDTGEYGDAAAEIMEERREEGRAPKQEHAPVQTKRPPDP